MMEVTTTTMAMVRTVMTGGRGSVDDQDREDDEDDEVLMGGETEIVYYRYHM